MTPILQFSLVCIKLLLRGGRLYWAWVGLLLATIAVGIYFYSGQAVSGMGVTHLSDQVNWGLYISNFMFLGGVAAASVVLVIASYLYRREDVRNDAVIGLGIALAAVLMCQLFILADLGRPDRIWHMIPFIGDFHFPYSMLTWDALVLNSYLLFTLWLTASILYARYHGRSASTNRYQYGMGVLAIVLVLAMVVVESFLLSGHGARPLWNTAVLAPRFLAAAFAAGPALFILVLQLVERFTEKQLHPPVIDLLGWLLRLSVRVNLLLIAVELFTEFYGGGEHSASAVYLYTGSLGRGLLTPWIWTALAFGIAAVAILSVRRLRERRRLLNLACVLVVVEIWIEKGMGLVIPGFIPTPLGEVFEYLPAATEILVSLGILAIGLLVFTFTAKIAVPIELGHVRASPPTQ